MSASASASASASSPMSARGTLFAAVPESIWQTIFTFLNVRHIGRCAVSCGWFREIVSHDYFWRSLCEREHDEEGSSMLRTHFHATERCGGSMCWRDWVKVCVRTTFQEGGQFVHISSSATDPGRVLGYGMQVEYPEQALSVQQGAQQVSSFFAAMDNIMPVPAQIFCGTNLEEIMVFPDEEWPPSLRASFCTLELPGAILTIVTHQLVLESLPGPTSHGQAFSITLNDTPLHGLQCVFSDEQQIVVRAPDVGQMLGSFIPCHPWAFERGDHIVVLMFVVGPIVNPTLPNTMAIYLARRVESNSWTVIGCEHHSAFLHGYNLRCHIQERFVPFVSLEKGALLSKKAPNQAPLLRLQIETLADTDHLQEYLQGDQYRGQGLHESIVYYTMNPVDIELLVEENSTPATVMQSYWDTHLEQHISLL